MSLRVEEIDRIKYELGVSVTRLGAEPYITYVAIFDRVILPYLYDNSTTSSTTVVAGTQAIVLAANPTSPNTSLIIPTFAVGTSCVIDVGPNQEIAVLQALTGLSATFTFANAHTGTYPVSPNGSEQIVRAILARIDTITTQLASVAPLTAGVEAVDEAKLYPSGGGSRRGKVLDKFQSLVTQREQARDDLGEALGYPNLRRARRGGGSSIEVY